MRAFFGTVKWIHFTLLKNSSLMEWSLYSLLRKHNSKNLKLRHISNYFSTLKLLRKIQNCSIKQSLMVYKEQTISRQLLLSPTRLPPIRRFYCIYLASSLPRYRTSMASVFHFRGSTLVTGSPQTWSQILLAVLFICISQHTVISATPVSMTFNLLQVGMRSYQGKYICQWDEKGLRFKKYLYVSLVLILLHLLT